MLELDEKPILIGPAWYVERLRKAAAKRGYKPEPWPKEREER